MITDSQTGVDFGQLMTAPGISPLVAFQLDQKVGDGIPTTGRVVALTDNDGLLGWVNGQPSDSATSCYNTTTSRYSTNMTVCLAIALTPLHILELRIQMVTQSQTAMAMVIYCHTKVTTLGIAYRASRQNFVMGIHQTKWQKYFTI